jgi:DNA modification methylase
VRQAGVKPKDLYGIPWRVAFALQAEGWYLRQDIIWHKPNPMPESIKDRCTKAHEYIFMLSKSERYHFDYEAIKEPAVSNHPSGNGFKRAERVSYQNADGSPRGNDKQWVDVGGTRNRRSVWSVPVRPFKDAHFATFPPDLIEPCVLAGCPEGGTVLDPFFGAGTTGLVAQRLGRRCIGIELNPEYIQIAQRRLGLDQGVFA